VDVFAAAAADHEGLAPSHGHEVHPGGFLCAAGLVEIGELADVVNLQVHRLPADLAASSDEPVDQLVAPGTGHDRSLIDEDGCVCSPERDPAEADDQWFAASFTLNGDLEDRARLLTVVLDDDVEVGVRR
jgi:hypothetical protein